MKKKIKCLGLIMMLAFSTAFVVGCGDDGEKQQETAKKINISEHIQDTVVTVGDYEIKLGEVMWYVYLMETEFEKDAKEYREKNNSSYYDLEVEGGTVEDKIRNEIIDMIYYYEIMYKQVEKNDLYNTDDDSTFISQANEKMEQISKENIESFGLDVDFYSSILEKWSYTDIYYNQLLELYTVDEDDLMKQQYTKEQLEKFTDNEYKDKAQQLADNYKRQMFNKEFSELEENYPLEINEDIWDKLDIGNYLIY